MAKMSGMMVLDVLNVMTLKGEELSERQRVAVVLFVLLVELSGRTLLTYDVHSIQVLATPL